MLCNNSKESYLLCGSEPMPAPLALSSRPRRATAGNRMMAILKKEEDDGFYQNIYGGFEDEGDDTDYM